MQHDMMALVSHDLKNPLAAIKGQAEVLIMRLKRMGITSEDPVMRGAERIQGSAGRMEAMLNHLVDVTLVRMGRQLDLVFAAHDLAALSKRVVAEQQRRTPTHHIEFPIPHHEFSAQCDGPRLQQMIENLLSNAVKYSPAGSTITVQLEDRGDNAVLVVTDEGKGIPARDLPHVFDRSQHPGTEIVPGKRLGLPMVKQIVEQHGGSVSISSREGEGTQVVVCLPLLRDQT